MARLIGSALAFNAQMVESPGGTSPPGSHRTVRETLASYGSSCPLEHQVSVHFRFLPSLVDQKSTVGHVSAFAPSPLQKLHRYYELIRPCAPHRYSHTNGASARVSPLASERQVPKFHAKACIKFMPPLCRLPFSQ
jgi:hypothetical protein